MLRYDERRQDKIQELVCQAFEKYQSDLTHGRQVKKQNFKCFVTQRAKQLDLRSVVKDGYGGTSKIDVLGFYNRRPNSAVYVSGFEEWMPISMKSRETIDELLTFGIDYSRWKTKLSKVQTQIVEYLVQGFRLKEIAEKLRATVHKVRKIVQQIREKYRLYFEFESC